MAAGSLATCLYSPQTPPVTSRFRRLRDAYPIFRIQSADAYADGGTVQVTFTFTVGGRTFRPSVEFSGLRPDEAARVTDPAAQRIIRALAIVEAASYWKATVSPVIEIGIGAADPAEIAWWRSSGSRRWASSSTATASTSPRPASCGSPPRRVCPPETDSLGQPGERSPAAGDVLRRQGFPGAHVRAQGRPGRLLPLQPHPVAADARPVAGRRRADHGSSPIDAARAAVDERHGRVPERAHALLGVPGAGSDADRVPAGQRCDRCW